MFISMKHSYSIEDFKKAVEESFSIAQALTKLGLSPRGGNYRVFKKFENDNRVNRSGIHQDYANKIITVVGGYHIKIYIDFIRARI